MQPIIIDFCTMLDPMKVAVIVSNIGKKYSHIMLPDSFRLIEIGRNREMPLGFELFTEDGARRYRGFYSYGSNEFSIVPENFIAGLELLEIAHQKGMVELFPTEGYSNVGKEILDVNETLSLLHYTEDSTGNHIRIHPDYGWMGLGALIGAQATFSATTVLSDQKYVERIKEIRPPGTIFGDKTEIDVEINLESEFRLPHIDSVESLFELAVGNELISEPLLSKLNRKKKEILIMGLEFGGTLTADTLLFGGIPVSSSALFSYQIYKNVFKSKPE